MPRHFSRDIAGTVSRLSQSYAAILLTGPRQAGKTSLLRDLSNSYRRSYVTLDDWTERALARTDPRLFPQLHPAPVFIDEIQYTPELFPYIKMAVDEGAAAGPYWLAGSQAFHMMHLARESLAGRAAILHMTFLSQHEIFGSGPAERLSLSLPALKAAKSVQTRRAASGSGCFLLQVTAVQIENVHSDLS